MSSASSDPLTTAISQFKASLTANQRAELLKHSAQPDATSILVFTAEIDKVNADRRSRCVSSRLFGILDSVKEFSSVADTFVSSHPEIAALVWGSLKFTILIANNVLSFFDKLSEILLKISAHCPRYSEYRLLFAESSRLQKALCGFYASVVNFCSKALHHLQQPTSSLVNAIWSPFEREFKEFGDELRERNETVKSEIQLASEMAAAKERAAAIEYRKSASAVHSHIKQADQDSKDWRLRKEQQANRVEKEKLLEKLSTYDYIAALRRFRKKRHGDTSSWLSHTQAFTDWNEDQSSGALWLSGIVGSGKSVVTAAVVSEIISRARNSNEHIAFFFCEYDNAESLKSRTIIGSLIRQCLTVKDLSTSFEKKLKRLFSDTFPDTEDLEEIFEDIAKTSKSVTLIIDGFDECPQADRKIVLEILGRLTSSNSGSVKVFISSREDVIRDIGRSFSNCHELDMGCTEAREDITKYVREVVEEKLESGELLVGDLTLVDDIKEALIEGSNGMFLWAAFQIQDLCRETCDSDLRAAIKKLPRDLQQTYTRILARISTGGRNTIVQNVFRWVGGTKRPLRLGELREAIAIHPDDEYLQRDRLVNDPEGIITWCQNLVVMDEDDQLVQFAHHSVEQFLLTESSNHSTEQFHFQKSDVDFMVGIACVVYLNFNDFERQVAVFQQPTVPIHPKDIAEAAIIGTSRLTKYMLRLAALRNGRRGLSRDGRDISVFTSKANNAQVSSPEIVQLQYPFLRYAREFWLPHTATLDPVAHSHVWTFWRKLASCENTLAIKPWCSSPGYIDKQLLKAYIFANEHLALASYIDELCIEKSNSQVEISDVQHLLDLAIMARRLDLVRRLYSSRVDNIELYPEHTHDTYSERRLKPLEMAAELGHHELITLLLNCGADINAHGGYFGSALLAATLQSHLKGIATVKLLLDKGADVNLSDRTFNTALQQASFLGVYDCVKLYLERNAEVNINCGVNCTALQGAIDGGHDSIASLLLDYGADPNLVPDIVVPAETTDSKVLHSCPLYLATSSGQISTVKLLLEQGADVDGIDNSDDGITPLMIASLHGDEEILKLLLTYNATVDGFASRGSALALAAWNGFVDIVKILLDCGADIDIPSPGLLQMRTALQAASEKGQESVVRLLLAHNANVDAVGPFGTALTLAIAGLHSKVVEVLIDGGANMNTIIKGKWSAGNALHTASWYGGVDIVALLLQRGADVNVRGPEGTALKLAKSNRNDGVAAILLRAGAKDTLFRTSLIA